MPKIYEIDSIMELNDIIAEILELTDRVYNQLATPDDCTRLEELSARYLELQPQVEC